MLMFYKSTVQCDGPLDHVSVANIHVYWGHRGEATLCRNFG